MAGFASVIIRTRNRARFLRRVLRSLACQTADPEHFEIVVVNDGSEDNTDEECQRLQSALPNMRHLSMKRHVGFGRAGNMGFKETRGDVILFTDDDCIVKEDWVERMAAALDQNPIIAGAIASPTDKYIKLCHNIDEFHPFLLGRKSRPVKFIAGANMGFQRAIFEELKGFRVNGHLCQDMELILRARSLGYYPYFEAEAIVTHDPDRNTFAAALSHSAFRASETILLRKQYRSLLKTPVVLRSPLLLLAFAPLIALKVTTGIYFGNRRLIRHLWSVPVVYLLKLAWCWGAARSLWKRGKK